MKTLTRHIGREVLSAIMLIFGALVMLFAFFDLIHELADVGKANYGITSAILFVALQMPSRMYELFPVAALIGTLFAMAQLVANSEYTVMRASGASLLQVTWAIVRVGIPIAVLTFLAGEFVAPPAERLAQQVRGQAMGDTRRIVAQQFQSGFWFKQDATFVNIRSVLADMTLSGVRLYEFDANLAMTRMRVAERKPASSGSAFMCWKSPSPAASWMAPSTPPPPRPRLLAAFTIASTASCVMSPRHSAMLSRKPALAAKGGSAPPASNTDSASVSRAARARSTPPA